MIFRLACMVIVAVRVLEGCGESRQLHSRIDVRWHRQTLEKEHLERRLHSLPTDSGIFINQVRKGAHFLLVRFRDLMHGGWFEAVETKGNLCNGNKGLYSQAFHFCLGIPSRSLAINAKSRSLCKAGVRPP